MAITADLHLHSSHSGDSETPMEEMVLRGIELGLDTMCFTEHHDIDYPVSDAAPEGMFLVNTDSYLYDLARLREKYEGKIRLLFGIELGLQAHLMRPVSVYAKSFEFDFIIGSSHICNGKDPYLPEFFAGRSEEAAYREYFESILENVKKFSCYDVYGHLDYVVRYGPNADRNYSYETYRDVIDEILKLLIEKEKGIEVNTGGIRNGLRDSNPCTDILRRYRELGGELVTIGSDAHTTADIAFCFDRAAQALQACGFQYYAVFEKRHAEFRRL